MNLEGERSMSVTAELAQALARVRELEYAILEHRVRITKAVGVPVRNNIDRRLWSAIER